MVDEMIKLRKMLDEEGIKWVDASTGPDSPLPIDRTKFWHRDFLWSVVNGFGSYGGWSTISPRNDGLLELMSNAVNGGEPIGWLTAEEVMAIVRENSATT